MRIQYIDGLRGHLLVGMVVYLLFVYLDLPVLGWLHHQNYIGLVDAEFFVPLAGFMVGHVGFRPGRPFRRFAWGRIRKLYLYMLGCTLGLIAVQAAVTPGLGAGWALVSGVRAALLLNVGYWTNILQLYILCFALAGLFHLLWGDRLRLWLGASVALYIAAQATGLRGFFGVVAPGSVFDVAAWQLLFIGFIPVGRHAGALAARWQALGEGRRLRAMAAALAVFAAMYAGPAQWTLAEGAVDPRSAMPPGKLLQVLAACALLAAILMSAHPALAPLKAGLGGYFRLGLLEAIGRWSIQAFALHSVLLSLVSFAGVRDWAVAEQYAISAATVVAFVTLMQVYDRLRSARQLRPAMAR